jgi:hypothetical protein
MGIGSEERRGIFSVLGGVSGGLSMHPIEIGRVALTIAGEGLNLE